MQVRAVRVDIAGSDRSGWQGKPVRRVYSEDLCLMREKEATSPRSRVYPSEQGHAEDENAVKTEASATAPGEAKALISEALERSSTRLTRKANRRELENGQSKTFKCKLLF